VRQHWPINREKWKMIIRWWGTSRQLLQLITWWRVALWHWYWMYAESLSRGSLWYGYWCTRDHCDTGTGCIKDHCDTDTNAWRITDTGTGCMRDYCDTDTDAWGITVMLILIPVILILMHEGSLWYWYSQIKIELRTTLPVQVDGEAWPQPLGYITITRLPDQVQGIIHFLLSTLAWGSESGSILIMYYGRVGHT